MNPLFHTDFSISDSLKSVRKSVLIYETIIAEAQGLDEAGKTVSFDELQPGDLIFYSFTSNGRYKNISHVAVYVGNGKVVEALNESLGVVYRDVASTGKIVVIGRP